MLGSWPTNQQKIYFIFKNWIKPPPYNVKMRSLLVLICTSSEVDRQSTTERILRWLCRVVPAWTNVRNFPRRPGPRSAVIPPSIHESPPGKWNLRCRTAPMPVWWWLLVIKTGTLQRTGDRIKNWIDPEAWAAWQMRSLPSKGECPCPSGSIRSKTHTEVPHQPPVEEHRSGYWQFKVVTGRNM
mgnify:CR=1 FL=1